MSNKSQIDSILDADVPQTRKKIKVANVFCGRGGKIWMFLLVHKHNV